MGTGELSGNLTNCWVVACDELASNPLGVQGLVVFVSRVQFGGNPWPFTTKITESWNGPESFNGNG